MTMITPSYLGETIEYSSLHACRSTLEDPTDLGLHPPRGLSVVLLFCAAALAPAQLFHLTDLGTLGGLYSSALGINASGQVVGYAYTSGGFSHAFVFTNGTVVDLGTLGGSTSIARGINSSGQITGTSATPSNQSHAFLYSGGAMHDLGTLGGSTSNGLGVNDSGQVAGWSYLAGNSIVNALLYTGGAIQDIDPTDFGSYALGINSSGQVVGNAYIYSFSNLYACAFLDGSAQDLGLGPNSVANAINDAGQIAGAFSPGRGPRHAFLFSGGTGQDLGTLGGSLSEAYGINASGEVVGNSSTADNLTDAFLYTNGTMIDLNSLLDSSGIGCQVAAANAVNSNGLVVGFGTTPASNGADHAFLLTPIAQNVVVPDSYSLFRGIPAGGALYSLQFEDAWYLSVKPGITLSSFEPPVQVRLTGTSPTTSPSSFQFTFTGNANTPGLTLSLELYDFTTNAYETVSTTPASAFTDSTVTVAATGSLSRFVDPATGEVRASVTFIATGLTLLYPWTVDLGVANWIIQ